MLVLAREAWNERVNCSFDLRSLLLIAGPAILVTSGPVAAQGWWDVESARMNALAGGPTNAYDASLLAQYGCYSGTRSTFCQNLSRERHPRQSYRARAHRKAR